MVEGYADGDGSPMLDWLGAYLGRDRFDAQPRISLHRGDRVGTKLMPVEARALAAVLLGLAGVAEKAQSGVARRIAPTVGDSRRHRGRFASMVRT